MNRISLAVLTAGALALTVAGCGSDDESVDASGLRKGTPTSSVSASATTTASAAQAPVDSAITCAEFKELDSAAEKRVIEQIIAENPGGPFDGSPNVALGTAKLVCLAPGNADKTVAEAAGMTP